MIKMKDPSFCFNSGDVGTPLYDMWRTLDAPEGIPPSRVAAAIWSANQEGLAVLGQSLQNVVINCHGNRYGLLTGGIGKHGLHKQVLGLLGILKPLNMGTFWLVSCDVAAEDSGKSFCQELAKVVGALVIASDSSQEASFGQVAELVIATAAHAINDFDGTVYSFSPSGVMRKGIDPLKDVPTVDHSQTYYAGKVHYWH
jgi:hypothetical protein